MGSPKITNHAWTEQELKILNRMWTKGATTHEISKVLKSRTEDAIASKVTRLRLHRPEPEIDLEVLEKIMKIHEC